MGSSETEALSHGQYSALTRVQASETAVVRAGADAITNDNSIYPIIGTGYYGGCLLLWNKTSKIAVVASGDEIEDRIEELILKVEAGNKHAEIEAHIVGYLGDHPVFPSRLEASPEGIPITLKPAASFILNADIVDKLTSAGISPDNITADVESDEKPHEVAIDARDGKLLRGGQLCTSEFQTAKPLAIWRQIEQRRHFDGTLSDYQKPEVEKEVPEGPTAGEHARACPVHVDAVVLYYNITIEDGQSLESIIAETENVSDGYDVAGQRNGAAVWHDVNNAKETAESDGYDYQEEPVVLEVECPVESLRPDLTMDPGYRIVVECIVGSKGMFAGMPSQTDLHDGTKIRGGRFTQGGGLSVDVIDGDGQVTTVNLPLRQEGGPDGGRTRVLQAMRDYLVEAHGDDYLPIERELIADAIADGEDVVMICDAPKVVAVHAFHDGRWQRTERQEAAVPSMEAVTITDITLGAATGKTASGEALQTHEAEALEQAPAADKAPVQPPPGRKRGGRVKGE